MIISQNSKEVNDLAINIIIGFYWSGDAVQKDSRRTAKWLAIVRCLWPVSYTHLTLPTSDLV